LDTDYGSIYPGWAGLITPGLYQLNFVVPDAPDGDHQFIPNACAFTKGTAAWITIKRQGQTTKAGIAEPILASQKSTPRLSRCSPRADAEHAYLPHVKGGYAEGQGYADNLEEVRSNRLTGKRSLKCLFSKSGHLE